MLLGVLILHVTGLGDEVKRAPASGARRGLVAAKARGEQAAARRSRRRSQAGKGGVHVASLVILVIIVYCAFNRSQGKVLPPDAQPFIREHGRKKRQGAGSDDHDDHSVL
jgi:hypothetical protein